MRIQALEVDHFGIWNGLKLKNLSEGVNLFFGPNETGKTTLMQFIRTVLYGFSPARLSYTYLTTPEKTGGRLRLGTVRGDFTLERSLFDYDSETFRREEFENSDLPIYAQEAFQKRFATREVEDGLKILDASGTRLDATSLQNLFAWDGEDSAMCVDETLYSNIFAVGLRELQQLSVLESTEAAKKLYGLSTGIERYSISRFLNELAQERERILDEKDTFAALEVGSAEDSEFRAVLRSSSGGLLRRLLEFRAQLEEKRNVFLTREKQYGQVRAELAEVLSDTETLTSEMEQSNHSIQVLQIAENLAEVWERRAAVDDEIVTFGKSHAHLLDITDDEIKKLESAAKTLPDGEREIGKQRAEKKRILLRKKELSQELSALPIVNQYFSRRQRMESVLAQQDWVETLKNRLSELRRTQVETEAQLAVDYRRLELPAPKFVSTSEKSTGTDSRPAFPYTVSALRVLRAPIREVRRFLKVYRKEKNKIGTLNLQAEEYEKKIRKYSDECRTRLSGSIFAPKISEISNGDSSESGEDKSGTALIEPMAVSRVFGDLASALRREDNNFEQLEKKIQAKIEIIGEIQENEAKKRLSSRETIVLGSVFVFGLTFSLFEAVRLFGLIPPVSYGASLLMFIFATLLWMSCPAYVFYRKVQTKAKVTLLLEQMKTLDSQLNRLVKTCFEKSDEYENLEDLEELQLFSEICAESRRKNQESQAFLKNELALAEESALDVSQREALLLEIGHHRKRLAKLDSDIRSAISRRKEILRSLDLPEDWKASNIRNLMESADRLQELWRRRERDIEDAAIYQKDLNFLAQRIEELLQELGNPVFAKKSNASTISFPYESSLFSDLRKEIQKLDSAHEKRAKNIQAIHALKQEFMECQKLLGTFVARKTRLLESLGLKDVEQLTERLENVRKLATLRERRRAAQREIDAGLQYVCAESVLWEIYEKFTPPQIAERRRAVENLRDEQDLRLGALHRKEEKSRARLRELEADESGIQLEFRIQQTDARIRHAVTAWRTSAMTTRLMETIRKTYQLKRQPKTLEDTSAYLTQMTDGKYVRVWTPMDEDILFVQRSDGVSFSAEQLSTGTRELLYLAIRLAFIAEYREKKVNLPVILDDVLVNFDRARAGRTVKLLCDFAGDATQILFFTSHEHIRSIFEEQDVTICDMA